MTESPDPWARLREPFQPSQIGKLPKINCTPCSKSTTKVCDRHTKSKCQTCGNWITTGHIHLDYVGHAAATHRLLEVDPTWTWEPVAWDAEGLPLVKNGCLWIRLTVNGVTRLGVGDAQGKTGTDSFKEMIGDAIRNAAMRFGVALDLWAKEDLMAEGDSDGTAEPQPSKAATKKAPERPKPAATPPTAPKPTAAKPTATDTKPVAEDAAYGVPQFQSLLDATGENPNKVLLHARRLASTLDVPAPTSLDVIEPGVLLDSLCAWLREQAA